MQLFDHLDHLDQISIIRYDIQIPSFCLQNSHCECQSFAIQLAWFLIKSLFIWAIKTISFILWLHYLLVQIGLEVELGETLLAPGTRLNLGFTCLRVKAFSTPDNSSLILLALFLSSAMILICVISRLIKHHWTDTRDIWSVICFNS